MLKIAVVGPESTGKTTLTEALANHYQCAYTQEYARTYLADNGPDYVEEDLVHIAGGQLVVEGEAQKLAKDHGDALVICDTDMLTIRIWSEEKFGRCHPLLIRLTKDMCYDLWLLCKPDIPWQPDPLRENPHDRDRLFDVYGTMLRKLGKPFSIIEGEREHRIRKAVAIVDALLSKRPAQ